MQLHQILKNERINLILQNFFISNPPDLTVHLNTVIQSSSPGLDSKFLFSDLGPRFLESEAVLFDRDRSSPSQSFSVEKQTRDNDSSGVAPAEF